MANSDKELDEAVAKAQANLAEAEKLTGESEKARSEYHAWCEENGIGDEIRKKFGAALTEEDKKKVAAEQEEWNRQIQHDLDAAVAQAQPKTAAQPKRPRSYV